MLGALFHAGVDVFRLNMSHGHHDGHAEVIESIREVSTKARRPAGILCDLSGPKIRIGPVANGPVTLKPGDGITITTEPVEEGSAERVSCNYKDLPLDVQTGQRILLDDGLLEFEVLAVRSPEVPRS